MLLVINHRVGFGKKVVELYCINASKKKSPPQVKRELR